MGKQAIGRLYKRRLIVIEDGGICRQFDTRDD